MRILMNLMAALMLYCICSGCTTTSSSRKARLISNLQRHGILEPAASEDEKTLRMLAVRDVIATLEIKVGTVFVVGLDAGTFSRLQASKGEDWPMLELGLDYSGYSRLNIYDRRTGQVAALVYAKVFSIGEGEAVVFGRWEIANAAAATYEFKFTKSPRGWELSSKTLRVRS